MEIYNTEMEKTANLWRWVESSDEFCVIKYLAYSFSFTKSASTEFERDTQKYITLFDKVEVFAPLSLKISSRRLKILFFRMKIYFFRFSCDTEKKHDASSLLIQWGKHILCDIKSNENDADERQ